MTSGFMKKFGGPRGKDAELRRDQDAPTQDNSESESPSASLDATVADNNALIEELKAVITERENENQDLKRKLALSVAEGRNMMSRFESMREQDRVYAIGKFIESLAHPFEALLLMFKHVSESSEGDQATVLGGIIKKFYATLDQYGVKRLYPLGEKFDHNFHQAVSLVKAQDDIESGVVISVASAGYMLHDRVLLPANVIVSE